MWQDTEQQLRLQVIEYARKLTATGLAMGTAGNVSARIGERKCLITPTGIAYELLQAADICKVSVLSGNLEEETNLRKPSSETLMHTRIYLERPDVGAIVHTHSRYATAFASAGKSILPVHYVIATLGDEIPVVPYHLYGSESLAAAAGSAIGQVNGLLLQNHGVMALGKDLAEAYYHAETIEYLAHLMFLAQSLGEPQLLQKSQLDEVRARFAGYGQKGELMSTDSD